MTETEIAALGILPDGEYAFQVLNAADDTSKKGNDMIVLDLCVFVDGGGERKVKDYLVPGTQWGVKKIHDFAHAVGLGAKYDGGEFGADDCLDRTGYCKIKTDKGKAKEDGSGSFPDRNAVAWYLVKKPEREAAKPLPDAPAVDVSGADEDVPF